MNIHEYQGKEILAQFGVPVPRGFSCFTVDEAVQAARSLGGDSWIVKAQIHAGGRGKGGGVRFASSVDEVREHACALLGSTLKTHQTGAQGRVVRRLLIEEAASIERELYLGMVVDRGSQRVALIASSEGGMDIEDVAAQSPQKILAVTIDPRNGLTDAQATDAARRIGVPETLLPSVCRLMDGLYRAFVEREAMLAEINPLVLTRDGRALALDAKFDFDGNALFRQEAIAALRDLDEEDPAEVQASKHELAYIALDGDIGCLVNGAGLAMATMDAIQLHGGAPANFLDVGGGATTEKVTAAFRLLLRNPQLKAILVNIFGGIMRCDVIAQGVVAAAREVDLRVPLVVRMKGTNEDLGKTILAQSGLPILGAEDIATAAHAVVTAARRH